MSTGDFYDSLASVYHLVYADWEASVERQARTLDAIIRAAGGDRLRSVLDAACGIGTQSLGLARLGYEVTASDLSSAAVQRAGREAARRRIPLTTSVADMRHVFDHHGRTFDVVIACDNSVPHLLSDGEILRAVEQFYRCTAPGGLCIISVRDYDALERGGIQVLPHGVRQVGGSRYVLLQVWEWDGDLYHTTMFVIEHPDAAEPVTRAMRATYYAIGIPALMELMRRAGFTEVERIDGEFFQPLIVGTRSQPKSTS